MSEHGAAFFNAELHNLLDRQIKEGDVSIAEAVGILELTKLKIARDFFDAQAHQERKKKEGG